MGSSNDDSNDSELGAKVLDIRDRLPLRVFGDNPTGELATKLFKMMLEEGGPQPHVWFASLMVTSYAFQRMLKQVYGVEHDKMQAIFAKALEDADSMEINIQPKAPLKGV